MLGKGTKLQLVLHHCKEMIHDDPRDPLIKKPFLKSPVTQYGITAGKRGLRRKERQGAQSSDLDTENPAKMKQMKMHVLYLLYFFVTGSLRS